MLESAIRVRIVTYLNMACKIHVLVNHGLILVSGDGHDKRLNIAAESSVQDLSTQLFWT